MRMPRIDERWCRRRRDPCPPRLPEEHPEKAAHRRNGWRLLVSAGVTTTGRTHAAKGRGADAGHATRAPMPQVPPERPPAG
jgi:hypothetical protein